MHRSSSPLILAFALLCGAARADGPAATAFDRGVVEMRAGNYAVACPLLAESHQLDPKLGVLFTLAECELLRGRRAESLARYEEFLDQLDRLDPADARKHEERKQVALERRQRLIAELPPPTVVPRPPPPRREAAPGIAPPPADPGATRRTIAYASGVVGLAGLGVGAVAGLVALDEKRTVADNCAGLDCNHEGKRAADRAQSLALVSTVGFGVGAAGLTAALVLLVTLPEAAPTPTVAVGPRGGTLGVAGRF